MDQYGPVWILNLKVWSGLIGLINIFQLPIYVITYLLAYGQTNIKEGAFEDVKK